MTISKAFKKIRDIFGTGMTPRTTKRTAGTPTLTLVAANPVAANPQPQLPTRDELHTRMIQVVQRVAEQKTELHTRTAQILQGLVDKKVTALKDAINTCDEDGGDVDETNADALSDALESFGAGRLEWAWDVPAFLAALEHTGLEVEDITAEDVEQLEGIVDMINRSEYTFLPDVCDDNDLGIQITGAYNVPDFICDFICFEDLGSAVRENHGGEYTRYGYFQTGNLYNN